MDPTDPAPLHLTAQTLTPILSHLARSPPPTSSHGSRPPLDLDLAASTLDLLAQVQLEDERMDKEERTPAEEREGKRARFFAWGGLFRTTYCHALLLRATSSKFRPRTKLDQRGVEMDFVIAVERLFLRPIEATLDGNEHGDADGHHDNGIGQPEGNIEAEFFMIQTTPDEWQWLEAQHTLYMRLFEGWLETGKLEKKQLPRSAGFDRIADRLQKFVDEVVERSEALMRGDSEVPHMNVRNGQSERGQVIAPTQPRAREREMSEVRREDRLSETQRPGLASINKGKQREGSRPDTGPMRKGTDRSSNVAVMPVRAERAQSSAAIKMAESDADRLRRLKRSLNGGRDLPDPMQQPLTARRQDEDERMDPTPGLRQERGGTIETTTHGEGRRRTRFSLQGDEHALRGTPASRGRDRLDDVQHEQDYKPQYYPSQRTQAYASSASGSVRPPRTSLSARHVDRERERERSVSVLMPDLPPGTILRVNERGQAEVLRVDHPVIVQAQEEEDEYGREYQDPDRDGGSRMDGDEMDWRGASFLDEDLDIDPDIDPNMDMEVDDRISVGSHRPSVGPAPGPGPAGYRWALIPDEPEYVAPQPRGWHPSHLQVTQGSREHQPLELRPRQPYPNHLRRTQASVGHQYARSISNQGRLSLPNSDYGDSRHERFEGRSSVQPSSTAGRTRYLTPIPDGSRAGSVLGNNPRRRHTDFIRPVARSPLALSSSQTGDRQGVLRRRQGHSLGGLEGRSMGGRRESILRELEPVMQMESLFDNSLESDDSPFHQPVPPDASVPLPRAQHTTRTEPVGQASRSVEQAPAAPLVTTSSRPAPPAVVSNNVGSSPRGHTSQITSTNGQTNHIDSSPLIQRFRPFDNHKVLRNPQNARRARTSTGLHTGRPEFQLAGANEPTQEQQPEPITQRGEEEEQEAPAPAISAKSARQREREEILAQRERSRRRASRIFRTSDDDEDD